ncbi:MAG: transcription termination/antitermination factor NusG [Ruminococcus sp.]|nr:transcription termination/antitermination factor NusG [Ruminococcus sp.]MBQ8826368.1 transcription termination/antitermination factor NusG [Oscillospiraceae bacterium]
MSEAAKWYVVHTYSGYENKVAQNIEKVVENRKLHELIQEVRVPTERVIETVNGKEKEFERKTFPGYVLIKMVVTDDTWYIVRNTRGCTGFVGPASVPTPLSEEEVMKTFGVDVSTPVVEVNFKEGDSVQISGTAMDGFIGVVQSINYEDRTVDLLVSMFGRETPTTLPISQVVAVD